MKTVYVFGNEFLEGDTFAHEVASHLLQVKVEKCRSPDDLLSVDEQEILLLDVVKGVEKPVLLQNVDQLKSRKLMSLHDFDLGFFLKLLDELGLGKKIKILGVPSTGDARECAAQVMTWITHEKD